VKSGGRGEKGLVRWGSKGTGKRGSFFYGRKKKRKRVVVKEEGRTGKLAIHHLEKRKLGASLSEWWRKGEMTSKFLTRGRKKGEGIALSICKGVASRGNRVCSEGKSGEALS